MHPIRGKDAADSLPDRQASLQGAQASLWEVEKGNSVVGLRACLSVHKHPHLPTALFTNIPLYILSAHGTLYCRM